MGIIATTQKFCGGYVKIFGANFRTDSSILTVYVQDSIVDGVKTSLPAIGSRKEFNFNNHFKFEGDVISVSSLIEDSVGGSYKIELDSPHRITDSSDLVAGLKVNSMSVNYIPSNADLIGDKSKFSDAELLTGSTNIYVGFSIYGTAFPASNYGSKFNWGVSAGINAYGAINDCIYRSYIKATENAPNGNPMYFVDGVTVSRATTVSLSPPGSPTTNDTGASTSPPTTTTTTTTTTTSQINTYGVGTTVTTSPNNGTTPVGTTVTSNTVNGYTTKTTVSATQSEIVTTIETSFTPSRNTTSPNIAQKQQAFNQPASFKGSIDPTLLFPSIQIYPSGSYVGKESGKFFGRCASPTSFDIDPYFQFSTNDFGLVAKDNRKNSNNINIKKDPVKDHVRTMGLKGPMYYSGWGYDTRGLPVPNASGTTPSGEYLFHEKTSVERKLWKTGPIDFRWHDKRKVWIGGHEMLEGYLKGDLSSPSVASGSTTVQMSVLRIASPSGLQNKIPEFITITNRDTSLSASSGTYCIAVDINYEWRPIYIGC